MNYELKNNTNKKTSPGKYYPLGAAIKDDGVNFAIYSQNASEVFLLLFNKPFDDTPSDIIKIENTTKNIFHVFVHGLKTGQLYGYKIKGQYQPLYGLRFNDNKLLIDPYAKAFTHKFENKNNLLLAYDSNSNEKDLSFDKQDNTMIVPKCIVIDDKFNWENDTLLEIPFNELVIYEMHVKGFTASITSKVEKPGTYPGFIEKIPYLKKLGINAVELLPIHENYIEDFLINRKLTNYWGYNTIGFFAPELSYSTQSSPGCQVNEFKTLVKELHKSGIEVILDVVYNHTAEGNELGPTMCFKGIDNPTYYCLSGSNRDPYRYYMNYTGCGNSVNLSNPYAIKLVLDSLRYWVETMHVDGFRFDLASVLGRENGMFQKSSSFFDSITQDPVLNRVKLIAEPWDLGTYQVGNFPADWSEWNGKFRDNIRKFVKGDSFQLKESGYRLTGSSDLYGDDGRTAFNSVNFITCHDGFTLYDLVSYNSKHNEANLENNNDGSNDNNSWNCAEEGETKNEEIKKLRIRQIKNFGTILLLSAGTPMLLGGDEIASTQKGNNNAYCQDNDISYYNWDLLEKNKEIFEFYKKLIEFRKKYTVFQRRKFFTGKDLNLNNIPDLSWFDENLNNPDWNNPEAKSLAYLIDGSEEKSKFGDYYIYIILNSDYNVKYFKIPNIKNKKWYRVIDTFLSKGADFMEEGKEVLIQSQGLYIVNPRSIVLLLGK